MKKILVIGSGGAGKSTLARRLSEISGIEVIHLDKLYWLPDWTEPPKDVWLKIVEKETAKDTWIMDGNFGSTLEIRLKKCDTVLFLDLSRTVCLWRVVKRAFIYRGKTRPDMGANCNEKIDFEFLQWIWNYPKKNKLKIENLLEKYRKNVKIVCLKSRHEVENFLSEISEQVEKS